MKILAVETSCDETSAAVVLGNKEGNLKILSNIISSSLPLHSKTGGIIPETAAREQLKLVIPVIDHALEKAKIKDPKKELDKIAVTIGPGLIGSLLVGVETAKTLSFVLKKPIIPINHLLGHIYANFVATNHKSRVSFPAIVLIVSGGHTDLLLMKDYKDFKWLGGTRDDAAGEAFDKIGRLLKLPYPGGPSIEKAAKMGNQKAFNFPKPMIESNDFDFSFSGLKTAVLRETLKKRLDKKIVSDISASVQKTIIDVLLKKTLNAAKKYDAKSILLSGGVAANEKLREQFMQDTKYQIPNTKLFIPIKSLCTDNAAMIGAAAYFMGKEVSFEKVDAIPDLYFN
ncbi:MAG: tRNA (adenosine(37)-N6)-threonylcarbamoyltransferase complex transferase subunit TsaD [Candidatus Levybacteria bacterium RBG_16_35_11]|nr:MAG: tRNA (adenosine(37)-N6)-threonylcarbamoyltransferase complex transferase subunit TsaD [Candidatus Levybacteria bacterium RBG_16_35_11]